MCVRYHAGKGMELREHILAAVAESRLSERRLSVLATGSTDTIRNIRRGSFPRIDTLERLCRVLGLEIQIRPGLLRPHEDAVPAARPPTEFSASRELPVYDWEDRTEEGYLRRSHSAKRAPAPVDLADELAFYLQVPDDSMVPAKIGRNEFCLVSPCAKLEVDRRAWFRGPTGRETVKWVMRLSAGGYDLGSWLLKEGGHQRPTVVHWARDQVVDRAVVLAVYREEPAVTKQQEPRADWRPDGLAELWRGALLGDVPKEIAAELDKAVSILEETEMQVKRVAARGTISDFHAGQVVRVLDNRLQASVRNMRSAVTSRISPTDAVARPGGDRDPGGAERDR